jgi:hypothetical protein
METKFRIIETEEYTLAVSDGVKAGDYIVTYPDLEVIQTNQSTCVLYDEKVIAYKPKSNAPELDLPLLPEEECCEGDGSNCNGSCCIVEDDVEKLAESYYTQIRLAERTAFKFGYKAATKVYSEDDVCDFVEWMNLHYRALEHTISFKDATGTKQLLQRWIQSKTPKTPKWFVAEVEYYYHSSKELYSDAGFVKCTKEQYESIKSEIPTCPLKIELKTTTINNKIYLEGTYLN